ncbi:MAG: TetR/AcrR family transcriptional regulator [Planctomycetes bacterium]|nr:TetR/AcrR family transcriptional regulator [Planctomycetota bacterium]
MNTTKPKQERSRLSKNKILESAIEIFAQKGPAGTRVDEIEAKAGVNKQRIYAYFGSKDNLYRQVLLKVYAQATENEKLLKLSEKNIPEMTKTIINSFFEFHQQNPLFWRLLAWENLNGGKSLSDDDWKTIESNYIEHLRELYKTGQEKGLFDKKILFSTYLISIFAITFFYYSNQLTISNLLSLDMEKTDFQSRFINEVQRLFVRATQ